MSQGLIADDVLEKSEVEVKMAKDLQSTLTRQSSAPQPKLSPWGVNVLKLSDMMVANAERTFRGDIRQK